MRRKDREVQSLDEIFDILNRCDTVRIAFQGDKSPYCSVNFVMKGGLISAATQVLQNGFPVLCPMRIAE